MRSFRKGTTIVILINPSIVKDGVEFLSSIDLDRMILENNAITGSKEDRSEMNFQIIRNSGRGDCLFLAFSQHTYKYEGQSSEIRSLIVNHVGNYWTTYGSDAVVQHQQTKKTQRAWTSNPKGTYLAYMNKKGALGSITEIIAFSELKGLSIGVIQQLENCKFRVEIIGDSPKMWLLFTGDFRNGHWELVIPLNDKIPTAKHIILEGGIKGDKLTLFD